MFSLNEYFEKKWVGRAMENETIYWDGLTSWSLLYCYKRCVVERGPTLTKEAAGGT